MLNSAFDRKTNADVNNLLRNYKDIEQVRFFANAINTRTRGVDAVLNGAWKIKKANLTAMLGANFTQTRLFGAIQSVSKLKADSLNTNTLFSREEKAKLEKGQPDSKIIFSLNFNAGKWGALLRNTRFGRTMIVFESRDPQRDQVFSPKILTDFSLNFAPKAWFTVTTGANNIFDVYPERISDYRNTTERIHLYALEASPFGFNGGYYFVSISLKFSRIIKE